VGLALAVKPGVDKETSIIDIIEDEHPFSLILVAQPVINELEYIRLRIPPAGELDLVCNVPIALLKTPRVACVDPENPRFRRSLSGSIRVFDGKLRLSISKLAVVIPLPFILTRRRLGRRARSKILV